MWRRPSSCDFSASAQCIANGLGNRFGPFATTPLIRRLYAPPRVKYPRDHVALEFVPSIPLRLDRRAITAAGRPAIGPVERGKRLGDHVRDWSQLIALFLALRMLLHGFAAPELLSQRRLEDAIKPATRYRFRYPIHFSLFNQRTALLN